MLGTYEKIKAHKQLLTSPCLLLLPPSFSSHFADEEIKITGLEQLAEGILLVQPQPEV